MADHDAAGKLLSGALVQRRATWNRHIATWDQIAIAGSIVVWIAIVRWPDCTAQESGVVQIAAASALTSLLFSVWRWQVRLIDDAILGLNAATRLCERELLPSDDLCTVKIPDVTGSSLARCLSEVDPTRSVSIPNTKYGGRGHTGLDLLAILVMVSTGVWVLLLCVSEQRLTLDGGLCVKFPAPLVLMNLVGIGWVLGWWIWWRRQSHLWPQRREAGCTTDNHPGPEVPASMPDASNPGLPGLRKSDA
jgi:hypothetical protein